MAILLHHSDVDSKQEDDAAGFLVVRIKHVIEALGLDVGTVNGKATPSEAKLLIKDTYRDIAHGDFSFRVLWA